MSLPNAKHIEVGKSRGRVTVTIDDWELFDVVEDLLVEDHNLDFEYYTEVELEGRKCFVMHFAESVSIERIERAIRSIPEAEVERIWRLNNEL